MTKTEAGKSTNSQPVLYPLPAALLSRVVSIGGALEAPCLIPAFELDVLRALLSDVGFGPHSDAEFTTVDWLAHDLLHSVPREPSETDEEYRDHIWSSAYDEFDEMTENDAGELACWLIRRLGFVGAYEVVSGWTSR